MRTADDDAAEPAIGAQFPAAILEPQEIAGQVAGQRAFGGQLVHHLREIVGQDPVSRGQQAVGVLPLGHALAVLGAVAELVAFDQRDAHEMVGERAGRGQPRHAAAEYDRVPSCRCHDAGSSLPGIYGGRRPPDRALARS